MTSESRKAVSAIHDGVAAAALEAERTVVAALGGGCQLPLGALATVNGAELEVLAVVCSPDGGRVIRAHARRSGFDSGRARRARGRRPVREGASEILNAVRKEMR